MKILMVSSFLPFPLFSGGQVRLYNLLKELSLRHEITLICEKRNNQTDSDIKEIEKLCRKVICVDRRKQWSAGNLLKTAGSAHSFLITGHTNKNLKNKIIDELNSHVFDLIHVETFYVLQNLPDYLLSFPRKRESMDPRSGSGMTGLNIPIVLAEHNVEYQVYQRYINQAPSFIRPFLALDIAKIKKEEETAWKRATKLIAVSQDDKTVMEAIGVKAEIVSNGVDIEKFTFRPKHKSHGIGTKKLLFIGDFKWIQNRDSVKFIIEEIWPEIELGIKNKELSSNLKLWIIGRKIPDSIKSLTNSSNVIFDEESSTRPAEALFQEADVLLAPIRIGGGTSYKILESMSCGTPVVTMPMSAKAINALNNESIMSGENAKELVQKTLSLLSDKMLYEKIAKNGRILIEKKYTWKNIAQDLENVYKSAI